MRGQYSIFQNLFDDPETLTAPAPERKGRNEALLQARNELLIHRYYYHIKIKQRQYLHTLRVLERDELFLTERTIIDIVQKESAALKKLHEKSPDVRYFRAKFPMWVW